MLGEKGHRIKELGCLKHRRGTVSIHYLKQVSGREETQKANLFGKTNIYKLELWWSENREESTTNDEEVLEGLQPYSNLKILSIQHFLGNIIPTWMMKMMVNTDGMDGRPLENLLEINLVGCKNCKYLPMLRQLPHLRKLKLDEMPNLKCIDTSFYHHSRHHSGSINETLVFFPALISFELSFITNMEELMKVEGLIFPQLESLEIFDYPKLTTVPKCFTSIKNLTIEYVNSISPLTSICRNLTTHTSLLITRVEELTYLPDELLDNNKYITKLSIEGSPIKSHVFPNLVSHKDLCIMCCEELTCFPSGLLQSYTSLHSLTICNCSNLITLPELEPVGTSLLYLDVTKCDKLTCLPALGCFNHLNELSLGTFSKELNSFLSLDPHKNLQPCLTGLYLYGWSHWESIPEQPQHLTSLTYLNIHGFGIETLPDWFGNLSSLNHIMILDCKKLEYLSNMESLTKLAELYILMCSLLKQRRPGWSEISRGTVIYIDGYFIRCQN